MKSVNNKHLLAAFVMTGFASICYGGLLSADGGFELWSGPTALTNWVAIAGTVTQAQQAAIKTQGNYSAGLSMSQDGAIRTTNFGETVQPDSTYTFSIDFYPKQASTGWFYVKLWLFDSGSNMISGWGPGLWIKPSDYSVNTWNTLTYDFGAGTAMPLEAGTVWALVVMTSLYGTFDGYVDNAQITLKPTVQQCSDVIAAGSVLKEDFNQDCYVDLLDLLEFSAHWLECNDPEDINCTNDW